MTQGTRLVSPLLLALIVSVTGATLLRAQDADIDRLVQRHTDAAVDYRHVIHQNPELSNREDETAALVADHLRGLSFDEVRTGIAHTGVVGILRGGRPGPVVAVRADMDALPVTEATGLPFASTKRTTYGGQEVGVMHACGHDIHVAVGLGVASVLSDIKADLPGTVVFIFQPAEEARRRARRAARRSCWSRASSTTRRPRPSSASTRSRPSRWGRWATCQAPPWRPPTPGAP